MGLVGLLFTVRSGQRSHQYFIVCTTTGLYPVLLLPQPPRDLLHGFAPVILCTIFILSAPFGNGHIKSLYVNLKLNIIEKLAIDALLLEFSNN